MKNQLLLIVNIRTIEYFICLQLDANKEGILIGTSVSNKPLNVHYKNLEILLYNIQTAL